MRFNRVLAILVSVVMVLSSAAVAKTTKHHSSKTTTSNSKSKSKSKKGKKAWQSKGQKTITNDRTREIQEALIREHYLKGDATGTMDNATKAALTKLQQENGWQTKVVPDSRALIKLGLGPNQSNLLNPDTAALSSAVASSKNQR